MPTALSASANPGVSSWDSSTLGGTIVAVGNLTMTANPTTASVPGAQDGDNVLVSIQSDATGMGAAASAQVTGGLLSIEMQGGAGNPFDVVSYVIMRPDAP